MNIKPLEIDLRVVVAGITVLAGMIIIAVTGRDGIISMSVGAALGYLFSHSVEDKKAPSIKFA